MSYRSNVIQLDSSNFQLARLPPRIHFHSGREILKIIRKWHQGICLLLDDAVKILVQNVLPLSFTYQDFADFQY